MEPYKPADVGPLVKQHIKGNIARVGGSVDQFINYSQCKVTDYNLPLGTFGYDTFSKKGFSYYYAILKQEIKYLLKGEAISRDSKAISLDLHEAIRSGQDKGRFDCLVTSNVIEHSPNPIFLLLNFYFLTKENGWQFHAIPNFRYIYDSHRQVTTLDHLVNDFKVNMPFSDTTHTADYVENVIGKNEKMRAFHEVKPVGYPYLHYHVYDEQSVYELFSLMFEDVSVNLLKTESFNDTVVICRNKLNPAFLEKYGDLVKDYMDPSSKINNPAVAHG